MGDWPLRNKGKKVKKTAFTNRGLITKKIGKRKRCSIY